MADNSLIEWTDTTWQIVTGCSVVSPGCTNCYAMRLAGTRMKNHPSRAGLTTASKAGPVWNGQVRFNAEWLTQPLRWKRPRRIFVAAHGDLFHEGVTDDQLDQIFAVMALSPQHTFQVLTKRPERMRDYLTAEGAARRIWRAADAIACDLNLSVRHPADAYLSAGWERASAEFWPLPNVWLGVSVEDQARADERIPPLLATPAAVRWISAEPLLGAVDISRWTATANVTCKGCGKTFDLHAADPCRHRSGGSWTLACPHCAGCVCRPGWSPPDDRSPPMGPPADWIERDVGRFTHVHPTTPLRSSIDWVVAGGESGPGARPMHPDWARQLRDQCAAAGVPFLFKQWGDWRHAPDRAHFKCVMREPWRRVESGREGVRPAFVVREGKKASGRLLDGQLHDAFPEAR